MKWKFWKRNPVSKAKVLAIDMDGTLCEGECWTPEDVYYAKPRLNVIKMVNELAKTKFIVIMTARRLDLAESTIRWLNRHEVNYHAISHNKMPCDLLIDDKVMNVEDFLKGG